MNKLKGTIFIFNFGFSDVKMPSVPIYNMTQSVIRDWAKHIRIEFYDLDGVLVSYNQGQAMHANTKCNTTQLVILQQGFRSNNHVEWILFLIHNLSST